MILTIVELLARASARERDERVRRATTCPVCGVRIAPSAGRIPAGYKYRFCQPCGRATERRDYHRQSGVTPEEDDRYADRLPEVK